MFGNNPKLFFKGNLDVQHLKNLLENYKKGLQSIVRCGILNTSKGKEMNQMKNTTANAIRERYLSAIMSYFTDEDIGRITSNSFNFPIVEGDEEGWVEIVVKIPKESGDEGYDKREEYRLKLEEKAQKAEERQKAKEKKIERDKKMREEKKKKKGEQSE